MTSSAQKSSGCLGSCESHATSQELYAFDRRGRIDGNGVLKISKPLKLFIFLTGLILAGLAGFSLFLQSEAGRHWAQRETLAWIQREYGITIQYQSLDFRETALGWDLSFKKILWKLKPASGEDFPGQSIEELQLATNPFSLVFGKMPIEALRIKGLILRPTFRNDGILLQGAGLLLDQAQLAQLNSGSSKSGSKAAWPTIRVDDVLVELNDPEPSENAKDQGRTTVRIAAEWSAADGLRDIKLASPRIDLVGLGQQAFQLGVLFGIPRLSATTGEVLSVLEDGEIEDLQIHCDLLPDCVGSLMFRGLQWKEKNYLPGLKDLSARVEFKSRHIEVTIPHKERTLTWTRLYSHPVPINLFGTRIKMDYDAGVLNLDIAQTRIEWNRFPLEVNAQLKLPLQNLGKTYLQLNVRNPSASWNEVKAVLPQRFLGPDLMHALNHRLRNGTIHGLVLALKGPVLQFPFVTQKSGAFSVDAQFSAMKLAYLDQWPALDKCQGHLRIQGTRLGIDHLACQIPGLKLNQGKLEIPDFLAENPYLQVDLEAQGSLDASLNFLGQTPLRSIKNPVTAMGVIAPLQQTRLALTIPLKKNAAAKGLQIKGETSIPSAEFTLPRQLLTGTLHQIKLKFDQHGLDRATAEMKQANQKSELTLRRDRSGTHLDFSLNSPADSKGLGAAFRLSPAQSPQRIEGSLQGLRLQQGAAQMSIESLVWQGLDAPFHLKGQATVQDFGRIGSMLGLGEEFQEGRGLVSFDLRLPGNLDIKNPGQLAGTLDFDLKDGSIEKLSPTTMALINFANLKVFGLGSRKLNYSFLKGRLLLEQGTLATENFTVGLGALEVQAKGSIHYPTDSMSLEITMIPDLGSPAAALAIGLWNPLVGLGLFGYSKIQDKASDSRLNRLASQSYRMKGSIAKPAISLISILHLKEILPWTHGKDQTGQSQ